MSKRGWLLIGLKERKEGRTWRSNDMSISTAEPRHREPREGPRACPKERRAGEPPVTEAGMPDWRASGAKYHCIQAGHGTMSLCDPSPQKLLWCTQPRQAVGCFCGPLQFVLGIQPTPTQNNGYSRFTTMSAKVGACIRPSVCLCACMPVDVLHGGACCIWLHREHQEDNQAGSSDHWPVDTTAPLFF